MAQKHLYALFQAVGWSLFALLGLYLDYTTDNMAVADLTALAFQTAIGFLGSHVLRRYLRALPGADLPVHQVVPRAAFGILAVGAALSGMTWLYLKLQPLDDPIYQQAGFVILWVNWALIMTAWTALYFAVHYARRIQAMVVERWRLKAALHQAQLSTLRAQLNPHFMFNMLNSVRALIDEDPEKAREVVTRLARLLRGSLKDDPGTVSLSEELDAVRDYLSLEQVRLEERLAWSIEAHPETLHRQVPRMLVLNLVENAVKHGIAKRPEGGTVRIATFHHPAHWHLLVTNTGVLAPSTDPAGGLGLRNTRERLHLCYGDEAVLTLKQEGRHEVRADVLLPHAPRALTREPFTAD